MPMKYWKDAIAEGKTIQSTKTGWRAGRYTLFWHGRESALAQKTLREKAIAHKRKTKKR